MPAREAFKIRSPDFLDTESGDQNPGARIQGQKSQTPKIQDFGPKSMKFGFA